MKSFFTLLLVFLMSTTPTFADGIQAPTSTTNSSSKLSYLQECAEDIEENYHVAPGIQVCLETPKHLLECGKNILKSSNIFLIDAIWDICYPLYENDQL